MASGSLRGAWSSFSGALRPAGKRLGRFHYVATEVHLLGVKAYAGVSNDYCDDTLPLMLHHGFVPVALLTFWSLTQHERDMLRQDVLPRGRLTHEFPFLFHEGPADDAPGTPGGGGGGGREGRRDEHESTPAPPQQLLQQLAGVREARAYCRREAALRARSTNLTGTVKEANAYFKRPGTPLPLPPVKHAFEDWPYARAHYDANGKLKLN